MDKFMYILKTMDKNTFKITDQEFAQISQAQGLVFIKSCGVMVNTSTISTIYPESKADEIEGKKTQEIGYLHDGTKVKRYFGEWVIFGQTSVDDKGNPCPIKIDPSYYPEVAKDCVMSSDEWNEVKHLSSKERLELLENKYPQLHKGKSEMQDIKQLLEKYGKD